MWFLLFCICLSAVNGQRQYDIREIVFDSSCNISFDDGANITDSINITQFTEFFGQQPSSVFYFQINDICESQKIKLRVIQNQTTIDNGTFTWIENGTTCNSIALNKNVQVSQTQVPIYKVRFLYELENCNVSIESFLNDFDNAHGNMDRYSIYSIEVPDQEYFIRNGTDVCFNNFTGVQIDNVSILRINLIDNVTFGDYITSFPLTLSECQVLNHSKVFENMLTPIIPREIIVMPSNNFSVNWLEDCPDFDNFTYNDSKKEEYREMLSNTLSELLETPFYSYVGDFYNTYTPSFNISVTVEPFEMSVSLNTPLREWLGNIWLGFMDDVLSLPTINNTTCAVTLVPLEADTFPATTSSNNIQLTSEGSTLSDNIQLTGQGSTGESDDSISVSTPAIIAFSVGGAIIIGAVAIFIYKSLSKDNYNIINLV